ncbi:MAG: Hpt domain-containing protein [Planctomycetales bacterium]|jgi:two-component system sensor histidine kinase/response regulator
MTALDGAGARERCLEAGMGDFVSKPLCPDELSAALARVQQTSIPPPAPLEPETPAPVSSAPSSNLLIHWDEALRSIGSDQSILDTVVEAALEEMPRLIDQLIQAIESSDFEVIKRSAHTINGALRIFNPRQAIEIAGQIEQLGASSSLEKITPLIPQLKVLIQQVSEELQHGP